MHTPIYIQTHTHIQTYMHIHVHTQIHTYTEVALIIKGYSESEVPEFIHF